MDFDTLDGLVKLAVLHHSPKIVFEYGNPPSIQINDKMHEVEMQVLFPEDLDKILEHFLTSEQIASFRSNKCLEADCGKGEAFNKQYLIHMRAQYDSDNLPVITINVIYKNCNP